MGSITEISAAAERTEAALRARPAACREVAATVREAASMLEERLRELGFAQQVVGPRVPLARIDGWAKRKLPDGVELPTLLRAFWSEVGELRFASPGLDDGFPHLAFWIDGGWLPEGNYSHGLEVVSPFSRDGGALIECFLDELEGSQPWLPICGDVLHRDGVSGGGPLGLTWRGDGEAPLMRAFDDARDYLEPYESLGRSPPLSFLSFLRWPLLHFGAYPGVFQGGRHEALRRKLTDGLPTF